MLKEKQVKKTFLENFDQKTAFFGARFPSIFVFIGAESAFRKTLGLVSQNGFLEKYQGGKVPLDWQGVDSLRRGREPSPS